MFGYCKLFSEVSKYSNFGWAEKCPEALYIMCARNAADKYSVHAKTTNDQHRKKCIKLTKQETTCLEFGCEKSDTTEMF